MEADLELQHSGLNGVYKLNCHHVHELEIEYLKVMWCIAGDAWCY